jgi:hypothetical protein
MIGNFFKEVATTAIGIAASEIGPLAMEVVKGLHDNSGMSGSEKRGMAVATIRSKYPNVESAAINLAIETAWAIIKDRIK